MHSYIYDEVCSEDSYKCKFVISVLLWLDHKAIAAVLSEINLFTLQYQILQFDWQTLLFHSSCLCIRIVLYIALAANISIIDIWIGVLDHPSTQTSVARKLPCYTDARIIEFYWANLPIPCSVTGHCTDTTKCLQYSVSGACLILITGSRLLLSSCKKYLGIIDCVDIIE